MGVAQQERSTGEAVAPPKHSVSASNRDGPSEIGADGEDNNEWWPACHAA